MQWSEIDFESRWWTIPADKSKNHLAHRVPLSAAAVRVLTAVRENNLKKKRIAKSPWVFPSPRGNDHIREMQKAVQRIRRYLFEERGMPRAQTSIRGYWKHGRTGDSGDDA